MRLRKLVLTLAALAMVFALAACGQSQGSQGNQKAPDKMSEEAKNQQVAPKTGEASGNTQDSVKPPSDETFKLTVPKMERVKNARIPTGRGDDQTLLRDNVAIHLKGSGFPWDKEANVYIAGHRLGYRGTPSYYAFLDIDKMKKGDKFFITDSEGRKYVYEVFDVKIVTPQNLSVLDPVKGKNIASLQACTLPDYSNRIVVQAERKEIQKA